MKRPDPKYRLRRSGSDGTYLQPNGRWGKWRTASKFGTPLRAMNAASFYGVMSEHYELVTHKPIDDKR